jgi:hypothetical protein
MFFSVLLRDYKYFKLICFCYKYNISTIMIIIIIIFVINQKRNLFHLFFTILFCNLNEYSVGGVGQILMLLQIFIEI